MELKNKVLCVYDNIKEIEKFKKYNPFIYKIDLYVIYYGNIYNPPFFKLIIDTIDIKNTNNTNNTKNTKGKNIKSTNTKSDEYIMLWNMVLSDGYLILRTKYMNDFINIIHPKKYRKYDDEYTIIKKEFPKTLIIYNKYRVIDFIIIGVQKGGTTAAMGNLEKHPDISIPLEELHFYDRDWDKGINWYKSHFDYTKKMVGEKNPNIIYLDQTYPMIQKMNPYVKMILFLRNPIDRAYSAWHMFNYKYTDNDNRRTFEEACNFELTYRINEPTNLRISNYHLLQRGLYFKQIRKLLKYFSRDNILIVISENIIKNMSIEYNKIYNFLGLREYNTNYKKIHVGNYNNNNKKKDIPNNLYNKLVDFFKEDVNDLEKFLNIKTGWFL